jgi:hypothetical protein
VNHPKPTKNERKEDFERESLFRGKREREKRYLFRLKHMEGERELQKSRKDRKSKDVITVKENRIKRKKDKD